MKAGELGSALTARSLTLAVAESCTGGLLADMITDRAGASAYFLGGVCVYSDTSKTEVLGVPRETLARHGAVSGRTALAMARGVADMFAADIGIGITGIAGPGGGSPGKPVGTVFAAVVGQGREEIRGFDFSGDRRDIKRQAALAALEMASEFAGRE